MKKRLKAFTLIELIVSMAVISILMVGVMRLFEPVNSIYSTVSVVSHQRAAENGIGNYLKKTLQYATSVGVYSDMTYTEALKAFKDNNYTDLEGKPLDDVDIDVIVIDVEQNFQVGRDINGNRTGANFSGRLIRKIAGTPASNFDASDYSASGIDPVTGLETTAYVALGEDYYGPADYYVQVAHVGDDSIDLVINSDYYSTPTKRASDMMRRKYDASGNSTDNSTIYTINTYNLRSLAPMNHVTGVNHGVDGDLHNDTTIGTYTGPRENIYIIFTTE